MIKRNTLFEKCLFLLVLLLGSLVNLNAQNNCNFLCNSDFEDKQFLNPGNWGFFHKDSLPCWETTATDNWIEIWSDGNGGIPAYSGNQFIELNANQVSTLYQDFTAIPGSSVNISFAHRGRSGNETISVSVGPLGGPYVALDTFTTGTSNWSYYTVSYSFPNNGNTNYSLRFNSLGGGSVGNFLDAISIELPKPEISFIKRNDSCGNNTGRLSATVTNGTAPFSYLWSNNSTGTFINNLSTGFYSLRVSDAYGCSDTLIDTVRNIRVTVLNNLSVNNNQQCLNENGFLFNQSNNWSSTTFNWNFDDATFSNASSPNKIYSNPGTYNVTLIGTMHLGCKDTLFIPVTVFPSPNNQFMVNNDEQCLRNNSFVFTNQSNILSGTLSYKWYFGNGDSSELSSPSLNYLADNNYMVSLISNSNFGCKDTAFLPIVVHPNPKADFISNVSEMCFKGNRFDFTNLSSVNGSIPLGYNWSFGDNQTSQLSNPALVYNTHGNYNVQLIVSTNFGCLDTVVKSIEVFPSPEANYTPSDWAVCFKNHSISFTNLSTIAYHNLTYSWDFGDGNSSLFDNPTHVYNNANNYNVNLVVTSEKNCADTITQIIEIYPMPVSSFTLNYAEACLNENVFQANNISSIASGTFNSYWYNNNSLIDSSFMLNYHFTDSGNYWIQLITVSNAQCVDTSKQLIRVNKNPSSITNFTMPDACFYQHLLFVNSTVNVYNGNYSSNYLLSDLTQYNNTNSFTHQFAYADTFTVTQIVTDDKTCTDTSAFNVIVLPQPKAILNKNEINQCVNTNLIEFTDLTEDNGISYTRTWQIIDENVTSNDSILQYQFNVDGDKKVYLLAKGSSGCQSFDSTIIEILPNNTLNIVLSNDSFCFDEQNLQYVYNGSIDFNDLGGLTWIFGDASISNSEQGTKIYNNTGIYNGLLISETDLGCMDTATFRVEILANPTARIGVNDSVWCLNNQQINLSSLSTSSQGVINSWNWNLGDNTSSINPNIINKRYNNFGIFPVSLIIKSSNSCSDTAYERMKVYRNPVAQFTLNQTESCLKGNRFVMNSSSQFFQNLKQNYWNVLSENKKDSGKVFNHNATSAGIHTIQLVSLDHLNCADTIEKTIVIHPQSNVSFTVDSVCFKEANTLISTSTIQSGVITDWMWRLGDGSQDTGEQISHTYNRAGAYSVQLITKTDFNCLDTLLIDDIAMVRELPKADFYYQKTLDSMHITGYNFYNNSQSNGTLSYLWNFNQFTNSIQENPFIRFYDTGKMTVTLLVTDEHGCSGTVVKKFINYPVTKMFTPNAFSPNNDGVNDVFKVDGVAYARKFKLEIFNRWGELLFETTDLNQGWDGKYKDEYVSEGVYVARIFYQGFSGEIYAVKDTITVLR